MYIEPRVESSYREHNIGLTIYDHVINTEPQIVYDFGVLNGYSTISIAQALRDLGGNRKVYACDLFDDYKFKHSNRSILEKNIRDRALEKYITVVHIDLFEWLKLECSFDMMHVDISNTGDIIEKVFLSTELQRKQGANIIFEGGTVDRDWVEWMFLYKKEPIQPLEDCLPYEVLNSNFPGLSVI
jgi:predicted O-methyltransferase YrrM